MKNYKTSIFIIVVALIVTLACARYLAIENNKINNELTTIQNEFNLINDELNATKNELETTKSELETAEENLRIETEKSIELNKLLEDTTVNLESANTTIADLKSEEYEIVYIGDFRLTFYCNEPYEHICGLGARITASGKPTEVDWTIAADTSVLPMGSIVYIEGFGFREVMDVGGGVNGDHIDILVDTHQQALTMGVNSGGVWILVKKNT